MDVRRPTGDPAPRRAPRPDLGALDWPFYAPRHRALAETAHAFGARLEIAHDDTDAACVALVRALGRADLLRHCVPPEHRGPAQRPDEESRALESRGLCVLREALAYHDPLADFAFAMQGLGSGAIALAGDPDLRARWLPRVARGEAIAAFALSEPGAGSDVGAMATTARRDGDAWVLDGTKTWISNGGIADFYTVFARTDPHARGARGIGAFVVEASAPGLEIAERIETVAPHPLATLRFARCRVPDAQRLGDPAAGFKLAMRTLDVFRTSVAAAALGMARRALDETVAHAASRSMFGATLADQPLAQGRLGELATQVDAAALLVARAAWRRDEQGLPTTREAAMAKLHATEIAQEVVDACVQLHGGLGVRRGGVPERLYREIRALRIYEGATEVQKLIVARELLRAATPATDPRGAAAPAPPPSA